MEYLASIQAEFLKVARKWTDLSPVQQRAYLKRHPHSKRRRTGEKWFDERSPGQKRREDEAEYRRELKEDYDAYKKKQRRETRK